MIAILLTIPDEWLLHDLRGDNGERRQKKAIEFLERLRRICDKLVVVKGSPWLKKARTFFEVRTPQMHEIGHFLWGVLIDSEKTLLFDLDDLQDIPAKMAETFEEKDHYLLRAERTVPGSIIVTTDRRSLYEPLKEQFSYVKVQLRDCFLREYLGKGG